MSQQPCSSVEFILSCTKFIQVQARGPLSELEATFGKDLQCNTSVNAGTQQDNFWWNNTYASTYMCISWNNHVILECKIPSPTWWFSYCSSRPKRLCSGKHSQTKEALWGFCEEGLEILDILAASPWIWVAPCRTAGQEAPTEKAGWGRPWERPSWQSLAVTGGRKREKEVTGPPSLLPWPAATWVGWGLGGFSPIWFFSDSHSSPGSSRAHDLLRPFSSWALVSHGLFIHGIPIQERKFTFPQGEGCCSSFFLPCSLHSSKCLSFLLFSKAASESYSGANQLAFSDTDAPEYDPALGFRSSSWLWHMQLSLALPDMGHRQSAFLSSQGPGKSPDVPFMSQQLY